MSPADFIQQNLRLAPVPGLPGIILYAAHAGSRLSQLSGDDAPYWAYPWAGGLAVAQHFTRHPNLVAGQRVLDLGAGSGLVGIVAAKAGALVSAAERDPNGQVAITLNAAANAVTITITPLDIDLSGGPPANIDLIAAGDVFYNAAVAGLMLPYLQRCHAAGIQVLIGDPQRRDLPLDQLELVASYPVGDVGDAREKAERIGSIYRLRG